MTILTVIEFPKSIPRGLLAQGKRSSLDIEERRQFSKMLRGYRAALAVERRALIERGERVDFAIAAAGALIEPLEAGLED